jgi:hypothetical protein
VLVELLQELAAATVALTPLLAAVVERAVILEMVGREGVGLPSQAQRGLVAAVVAALVVTAVVLVFMAAAVVALEYLDKAHRARGARVVAI